MKRWDFVGGVFYRIGRWWIGLVREFPYVVRIPVIAGGTDGMSSQGTFIGKGDGASPEGFSEIAEVASIGGPNEDSEELDMTHLRSAGGYREFLQSFKDAGELPLTLNFIPTNSTQDSTTGLRSEYQSKAVKNYQITFPDGTTCTFAAYVKAIGTAANVGDKLTLNCTLRITGATTWVEGSI